MKKIYYVTKNKFKSAHAREYALASGIEIEAMSVDLPEIQAATVLEVVNHKAMSAWETVREPLIVSDSGWEIPALGGFPGPYMKDINQWFTAIDFLNLMLDKQDRTIQLNHLIAVVIEGEIKIFTERTQGEFVSNPRGQGSPLDQVVIMGGETYTIAENQNRGLVSADGKEIWDQVCKYIESR